MDEQRKAVRLMQDYISEHLSEDISLENLPAATYLMFRGEPFEQEDYVAAINEIWDAEKKYNPDFIGYEWDDSNPRIQLQPIGERGYIELVPVKNK